jgi:hypothetical protein
MKKASSLLLAAMVAACAATTEPGSASLDRDFLVREGQQVLVDGERLTIRFQDVTEDSRCAVDVQCVWAGEGVVVLRLSEPGREAAEVTLRTTEGKNAGTYGDYRVSLKNLDPKPRSGGSPPETYIATLEVRRQ